MIKTQQFFVGISWFHKVGSWGTEGMLLNSSHKEYFLQWIYDFIERHM